MVVLVTRHIVALRLLPTFIPRRLPTVTPRPPPPVTPRLVRGVQLFAHCEKFPKKLDPELNPGTEIGCLKLSLLTQPPAVPDECNKIAK